MIKKSIKKIIIITLSLFFFKNTCYASSGFSVNYGNEGEAGTPSNEPPSGTISLPTNEENTEYQCYYEYNISRANAVTIYGYNQKNDEIINDDIKPEMPIPSGTSIGLNITERVGIKWGIDKITLKKVKTTPGFTKWECQVCRIINDCYALQVSYKATPVYEVIDPGCRSHTRCTTGLYDEWKNSTCRRVNYSSTTETTTIPVGDPMYNQCREEAANAVKKTVESYLGPSYKINLRDGNDGKLLNNNNENDVISITKKNSNGGQCILPDPQQQSYYLSGKQEIQCDYTYLINNVCMDKITSKVTYRGETKCKNNEITVPNETIGNVTHWHYFIPLDTTTNTDNGFSISMVYSSQSGKKEKIFCEKLINYNSNYYEFIKDASYHPLPTNKADAIKIVKGENQTYEGTLESGCYLGTDISIPVVQQFYGEEKKSGYTSLKGYGMYFRQIDINNPFPSGIDNSLYWYGFDVTKLKTSFDKPTYVAIINNNAVNKIKDFNNKYSYTDWIGNTSSDANGGMNANGKSNFVRKSGIITTKQSSFYKLGCGPTNANWVGCGNS